MRNRKNQVCQSGEMKDNGTGNAPLACSDSQASTQKAPGTWSWSQRINEFCPLNGFV